MKKYLQRLAMVPTYLCLVLVIPVLSNAQGFISGGQSTTIQAITVDVGGSTGIYIGKGGISHDPHSTAVGNLALSSFSATSGNIGYNSAFGESTIQNFTNCYQNSAFGYLALRGGSGATGNWNSAFGSNALRELTTGSYNAGLSYWSLFSLTQGSNNTGVGALSLGLLQSGSDNVGIGTFTMYHNTSGSANVAVGTQALSNATTGSSNVAVGWRALYSSVGSNNIGIGYQALVSTAGNNNIGIGVNSTVPIPANSNQLSIQNVLHGINMNTPTAANLSIGLIAGPTATIAGTLPAGLYSKFHIGGTSSTIPSLQLDYVPTYSGTLPVANQTGNGKYLFVDAAGVVCQALAPASTANTNNCHTPNILPVSDAAGNMTCSEIYDNGTSVGIAQNTGFGFTSGLATTLTPGSPGAPIPTDFKLAVAGWVSATAYTSLSDERIKKEIKKIENPLDKISKLSGYTYFWDKNYKTTRNLDDNKQSGFLAQEVLKALPEAVVKMSDGLYGLNYNAIMPLLAEGIKAQQNEIAELKEQIINLTNKVNRLVPGETNIIDPSFTIIPNPVNQTSIVSYNLQNVKGGAAFFVYDLQGKMLKHYSLSANTKSGEIKINKSDFGNGMYILSLVPTTTKYNQNDL